MLRVAEQYAASDTGRQRRANEDSLLARAPLFVVADGMGGAQAGEVASRIAVESFQTGLADGSHPELELSSLAQAANARIHALSHANAEQAGMGTTLTAVYVGEQEVAIAHVGDSRAYCLRDGELLRLTDDHSLVDELMRQGRLTPEEAVEHPQRSVITRALGPEDAVEVDTRSFRARANDVYLLCSDGLTTMLSEPEIQALLRAHAKLREAGEALIAAANNAGGRDNITVILLRLEEVHVADGAPAADGATIVGLPPVTAADALPSTASQPAPSEPAPSEPAPSEPASASARSSTALSSPPTTAARRTPRAAPARTREPAGRRSRPRLRHSGALAFVTIVLVLLASAAYLALQSVYFIGTNSRGLVTLYQGLPYKLPGNLALYSSQYVSGVSASTLSAQQRHTLLDHSLRSEGDAGNLIHNLELEQLE
ncbi:MAG TPA: Stp1/IreP family PP2C-type Ser/Thr phosphatase [Solirubrobacteraceae bacterium]|nr:Stp1/IreP family PP2C-type Ser/Thr phosphatase [Solirubrobacteraceae bacterium]